MFTRVGVLLLRCGGAVLLSCTLGCGGSPTVASSPQTFFGDIVYAQAGQTVKDLVDGLPDTGGTIVLGAGKWMSGYGPDALISKPNVTIQGSGMAGYEANLRAMSGGTIVVGPLLATSGADYLTIRDLGIDAGQDYINTYRPGMPANGLAIFNNGQIVGAPPVESPVIENVSCLGYSPTAEVHCMLVENVDNAYVHNVQTVMNCHGLVLKGTNSTVDGVLASGHQTDSVIVKSDVYAPASNDQLSNITIKPLIAPGDTKGIAVVGTGAPVANIAFSQVAIDSPQTWGVYVQASSAAVAASGLTFSGISVNYRGASPAGDYCMQFLQYVNNVQINGLDCTGMWAGIAPSNPDPTSFTGFSLQNSQFTSIATDAVDTFGAWNIFNNNFNFVSGNAIANPYGVTTVAGNTFTNIGGSDMLSSGGTFVETNSQTK